MAAHVSSPRPDRPLALLGGLTPRQFMRRHWQRKPLLVRAAQPGFEPLLSPARLFSLAGRDEVESRVVVRESRRWVVEHGPFAKSALPAREQPRWTLLVQGVDLHDERAHALLRSFRFMPDVRLDDLMISWASEGGGVGPHVDSYDVFLLQAQGRRRWRIGRARDPRVHAGAPLKILRRFVAEREHVLEAGDMLYLPPNWAHDGVAVGGECMTYSIGFRAPARGVLAGEVLQRLADAQAAGEIYTDVGEAPTRRPAQIPRRLEAFAAAAIRGALARPRALARALGEVASEPKANVWFVKTDAAWRPGALTLDRRTRMLYDARDVFVNGEAFRVAARDARLLRRLADERRLDGHRVYAASRKARALLAQWFAAGWLHRAQPALPSVKRRR